MKKTILCVCLCILMLNSFSQSGKDSTAQQQTNATIEKQHLPKTAAILSTVLPGSGQIYNGSWWKMPVVYAGFAGISYGLYHYQTNYKSFKTTYNDYRNPYLEQGLTPPSDTTLTIDGVTYSPAMVQQGRNFYRKYRDLCIIGIGVWYFVNILDAYVEAHLFEFDVSDDLTLQVKPAFYYTPTGYNIPSPVPSGVQFSMRF